MKLVRWPGPGILTVKNAEGEDQDLGPGDTCRVIEINARQAERGLREVGRDLGAKKVTDDVLRRELGDAQAAQRQLLRENAELRAQLRQTSGERDALAEAIELRDRDIDEAEKAAEVGRARIKRLEALVAGADVVDKPWLDAETKVLRTLCGALGGELKDSARRADLLAWLYTQQQPGVATAFQALAG